MLNSNLDTQIFALKLYRYAICCRFTTCFSPWAIIRYYTFTFDLPTCFPLLANVYVWVCFCVSHLHINAMPLYWWPSVYRGIVWKCTLFRVLWRAVLNYKSGRIRSAMLGEQCNFIQGKSAFQFVRSVVAKIRDSLSQLKSCMFGLFISYPEVFDSIIKRNWCKNWNHWWVNTIP